MRPLIHVEFFKLRKRMMSWVLALILTGLVVLLYTVLWSTSVRVARFGENNQFTGFATLAMILAAGAVGSEYAWGTVRLMATAASGRLRMISAKLLVVFALVAAGTLVAVAVALIYSLIITVYYGNATASFLTMGYARDQLESYGRTLFVLAPYVTLAFGVAIIGRSTLAGVGTGMGVAFLEPLIGALMRTAGSPWKDIPDYLLNANTRIILLQNKLPEVLPRFGGGRGEVTVAHSPMVAGLIVMTYTLVFIAVPFYLFRTRDIGASQ
jgi:ABC-type transport system involved in multi-copper enzyme maturation permease subunit